MNRILTFLLIVLFQWGVNALTLTTSSGDSQVFSHRTAYFGPAPYTYSTYGPLVIVDNICTATEDLFNKVVLTQRGCGYFTFMAANAQQLKARALIIANNDQQSPDEIIALASVTGKGASPDSVLIPTVAISYNSGKAITDRLQATADMDFAVTLDAVAEIAPARSGGDYLPTGGDVVPPPTDQTGFERPPIDEVEDVRTSWYGGMTLVWLFAGVFLFVKCCIITVACRRRYRANRCTTTTNTVCSRRCQRRCGGGNSSATALLLSSSSSSSSEGDLPAAVYATYPLPSSAFSVQRGDVENGVHGHDNGQDEVVTEASVTPAVVAAGSDVAPSPAASAAVSRPLTATALSAYPSIQYAPLMPQATAPSDVYDMERQPVVIRG